MMQDAPKQGMHVELAKFGFGKGCSSGLQEDVARLACCYPSMELAGKELSRNGVNKDVKLTLVRIAIDREHRILFVGAQIGLQAVEGLAHAPFLP
jgi:hypothetical protein